MQPPKQGLAAMKFGGVKAAPVGGKLMPGVLIPQGAQPMPSEAPSAGQKRAIAKKGPAVLAAKAKPKLPGGKGGRPF